MGTAATGPLPWPAENEGPGSAGNNSRQARCGAAGLSVVLLRFVEASFLAQQLGVIVQMNRVGGRFVRYGALVVCHRLAHLPARLERGSITCDHLIKLR